MLPALASNIHRLRLSDKETGTIIVEKNAVCILEMPKYPLEAPIQTESQRWQRLFIEGPDLDPDNLPDSMKTQEMEKVMSILKSFDDRAKRAMLYRDRRLKQI